MVSILAKINDSVSIPNSVPNKMSWIFFFIFYFFSGENGFVKHHSKILACISPINNVAGYQSLKPNWATRLGDNDLGTSKSSWNLVSTSKYLFGFKRLKLLEYVACFTSVTTTDCWRLELHLQVSSVAMLAQGNRQQMTKLELTTEVSRWWVTTTVDETNGGFEWPNPAEAMFLNTGMICSMSLIHLDATEKWNVNIQNHGLKQFVLVWSWHFLLEIWQCTAFPSGSCQSVDRNTGTTSCVARQRWSLKWFL